MPQKVDKPKHAPATTDKYTRDGKGTERRSRHDEKVDVARRKDGDMESTKEGKGTEKRKEDEKIDRTVRRNADEDVIETKGRNQKVTRGINAKREEEDAVNLDDEGVEEKEAGCESLENPSKRARRSARKDVEASETVVQVIEDHADEVEDQISTQKSAQASNKVEQGEESEDKAHAKKPESSRSYKHRDEDGTLSTDAKTRGQQRKSVELSQERENEEQRPGPQPKEVLDQVKLHIQRPFKNGPSRANQPKPEHMSLEREESPSEHARDRAEEVEVEEGPAKGTQSHLFERAPCPPVTLSSQVSDLEQSKEQSKGAGDAHSRLSTTEGESLSGQTSSGKSSAEANSEEREEAAEDRPQKRSRSTGREAVKFKDPREVVVEYPFVKSANKKHEGLITVTAKDFETLKERELLNDTIIDFYIKFIEQKMDSKERERCHFFSTFFWKKLSQGETSHERHKNVATWTRKFDIFEKDFLFIPICHEIHWTLAIICAPGGVVNLDKHAATGESRDSRGRQHTVLYLDSMGGYMKDAVEKLTDYLKSEWKEKKEKEKKKGKEGEDDKVTAAAAAAAQRSCICSARCLKLPQQDNSSDCGLFLLRYIEQFCDLYVTNKKSYEDIEDKETLKWFARNDISKMRAEIQNCILKLRDEWQREHVATAHPSS